MNHLWPDQAPYTVCNSSLSEYGVLGESDTACSQMVPWGPERVLYQLGSLFAWVEALWIKEPCPWAPALVSPDRKP